MMNTLYLKQIQQIKKKAIETTLTPPPPHQNRKVNLRVGVSSKDIFNDYNCLLNHIVHFNLDQFKQNTNASLSSSF